MLQRKFSEALALVQKFPGDALVTESTAPAPKSFLEGTIYCLQGDTPKGQAEFAKARAVSDKLLLEAPDDPARHAQHGLILAALGEKDAAIKEGKKAVELRPESEDAFDGPKITASLAEIYTLTGETDEAFPLIDHLLETPNGLTISLLKLDPIWEPLRNDPRFQALIDKYAGSR
jgi:tetratricopeptide (TPR) repeat protein